MKQLLLVALLLFTTLLSAQTQRVALLIGNSAYGGGNTLDNPIQDVTLINKKLKDSGFDTILIKDASLAEMKSALKKFQKKLSTDSVGLFYFAGHGIEIDGLNYLVPIDVDFSNEDSLKTKSLNINRVVRTLKEVGNSLNILILDACRDNPVTPLKKRGLAPFIAPQGLFVAYSAQSGEKAQDGPKNGNSPFAISLANNIAQPLNLETLFRETRVDVYKMTDGKQRPSTYSEILSDFYFTPPKEHTRALKRKSGASSVDFIRHKRFIEPKLVLIKAGSFTQGDNEDFEAAPAHKVTIEKDFYISAYEVTFEEFDLFCKYTGWKKPHDNNWGRGKQPVINITYNDAQAYVAWLSKVSHKNYKLISESQWEYVAHSKTSMMYGVCDDDALLGKYAWYNENANKHPHPIGTKKPNSYGVYDMLGNVAELTADNFYNYKNIYKLQNEEESDQKVLKGGTYFSAYDELPVYKRTEADIHDANSYTGFRIILQK